MMNRVVLIHWNADEAADRIQRLKQVGYEAAVIMPHGGKGLDVITGIAPKALLVDLSRLPSHGREIAAWVRRRRATRHLPIVFVDGEPPKVEIARKLLPDAVFTGWSAIASALRGAIENQPTAPLVPDTMAAYAGRPLTKKLGLRPDSVVALVSAPRGFERTLEPLPRGVCIRQRLAGRASKFELILLFNRSLSDLRRGFPSAARHLAEKGGLWLIWPKKASKMATDLDEKAVRAFGLGAGFVDYKICAVTDTWSGLLFTRRREK